MNRGRVLKMLAALAFLAAFAMLVPASPIYLPKIVNWNGDHDGHSTGYWIRSLDSSDEELRRRAIDALGRIGAAAGEGVPALAVILLEDNQREARIEASLALAKMAPASRAAVSALAMALQDKEPFVRRNAAAALLALRAEARTAVPDLIKALANKDNHTNLGKFPSTIQETIAVALGKASAGSDEAVPALLEALKSATTQEMRLAVAHAFGEIGAPARSAAPHLRALLDNRSPEVREAAAEALAKIGAPEKT
jgi:HEAT repeat protein